MANFLNELLEKYKDIIKPKSEEVFQQGYNQTLGQKGGVLDLAQKTGQELRDKLGTNLANNLINLENETAKKTLEVINPGSSYLTPFLEKHGVNPTPAFVAGLLVDIAAPGPGELERTPKAFKGFKDLTTKFFDYAEGKTFLSRQEILDFARRPELKRGLADLLLKKIKEFEPKGIFPKVSYKIPAQEFADSIYRDLLKLKPVKVKEPQYEFTSIDRYLKETTNYPKKTGKNYEEVVFESPIATNGSSHYPNSKNYFAHVRGDEVVEGGKKIWREQEMQSDLLQKDMIDELRPQERLTATQLERESVMAQEEFDKLQVFTNDRYGERIMPERIKVKAGQGYSAYRIPTGETIGKIEGFEDTKWYVDIADDVRKSFEYNAGELTPERLKVGMSVSREAPGVTDQSWIITDILGDGRFKAVPKNSFDRAKKQFGDKQGALEFLSEQGETFDLTGKSNPQYRRYEQWGKFLKNRYGGKEVIDPQGNSWVEVDLKPEYKKMPIQAFGFSKIGTMAKVAGGTLLGLAGYKIFNDVKTTREQEVIIRDVNNDLRNLNLGSAKRKIDKIKDRDLREKLNALYDGVLDEYSERTRGR